MFFFELKKEHVLKIKHFFLSEKYREKEFLFVLKLEGDNVTLLSKKEGTLTKIAVNNEEMEKIKELCYANFGKIVLVHNHPSSPVPIPSKNDLEIIYSCTFPYLDFIIINHSLDTVFSYRENKYFWNLIEE